MAVSAQAGHITPINHLCHQVDGCLLGVNECALKAFNLQTNLLCLSNSLLGSEDAADKGSLSLQAVCAPCTHVHRSSLGMLVTDTHISKADKSFSDGAAAAPLPLSSLRALGRKKAGHGAPVQVGSRELGTPASPALPGAEL